MYYYFLPYRLLSQQQEKILYYLCPVKLDQGHKVWFGC